MGDVIFTDIRNNRILQTEQSNLGFNINHGKEVEVEVLSKIKHNEKVYKLKLSRFFAVVCTWKLYLPTRPTFALNEILEITQSLFAFHFMFTLWHAQVSAAVAVNAR